MDKNKLNKRSGSGIKGNSLVKGLLRRMEEGDLTEKEQSLIRKLKTIQAYGKEKRKLSRAELNRAARRNRQAILQKRTGVEPVRKKNPIRSHILTAVAAVVLLLIVAVPLYKRLHSSDYSFEQDIANIYDTDYQFITEENIKKITLADGSVIYLNRESSLSLKKGKFNAYIREVWLDEGEAFFDITKDPTRPFIVHSRNGVSTRVLGTSFNIKSYATLPDQVISVNTGRVQIFNASMEKIIVDPNYKVSVSDENGSFIAGKTDARSVSDWRSGKIILDYASVEEVAFRIKQYYDKELIYDERLFSEDQIYSFFNIETPFEEVITVVCKLMNASFTVEEAKVYLAKNE